MRAYIEDGVLFVVAENLLDEDELMNWEAQAFKCLTLPLDRHMHYIDHTMISVQGVEE